MTPETPLNEVARFLAPETAQLLVHAHSRVQRMVLVSVKWAIIGFESQGGLDPITLQETLHDYVVSILVGDPDGTA